MTVDVTFKNDADLEENWTMPAVPRKHEQVVLRDIPYVVRDVIWVMPDLTDSYRAVRALVYLETYEEMYQRLLKEVSS